MAWGGAGANQMRSPPVSRNLSPGLHGADDSVQMHSFASIGVGRSPYIIASDQLAGGQALFIQVHALVRPSIAGSSS